MNISIKSLIALLAASFLFVACDSGKPAVEVAKVTLAEPIAAGDVLDSKTPVGAGILADLVRQGDVAVGKDFTMALGGRFHHIHSKLMAIKCATCHAGVKFPDNIQFLRREEFPLAAYPGAVDRGTCMGCHRGEGSLATRIYGVTPQ